MYLLLEYKTRSHKLLGKNIGNKLLDVGFGNDFFGSDSKSKGNKSKNKQMRLHQIKKLLYNKGNHQKNEKQATEWEKYLQIIYLIRG